MISHCETTFAAIIRRPHRATASTTPMPSTAAIGSHRADRSCSAIGPSTIRPMSAGTSSEIAFAAKVSAMIVR